MKKERGTHSESTQTTACAIFVELRARGCDNRCTGRVSDAVDDGWGRDGGLALAGSRHDERKRREVRALGEERVSCEPGRATPLWLAETRG